ncbi:MAG: hypothetical protein KAT71_01495, partial [Gammaproteobacteria bacterium]|nr:hypothetical protein [Gammaproteobacteria bacterium]
ITSLWDFANADCYRVNVPAALDQRALGAKSYLEQAQDIIQENHKNHFCGILMGKDMVQI